LKVLVPPLPWQVEQESRTVLDVPYRELNEDRYVDRALAANGEARSVARRASLLIRCIGSPGRAAAPGVGRTSPGGVARCGSIPRAAPAPLCTPGATREVRQIRAERSGVP
jgi:hypothetical protein